MNLEQRIARALEDSLTDAEFDTLSAEADAEPTFRDARPLPATPAPLPLDHDGRGPRVGTRCGDLPVVAAALAGSQHAGRPEWLYGTGCCDQWTPEDGCRWHTGRPAMGLAARELGSPAESAAAARGNR